jgi:chaperonin GroES
MSKGTIKPLGENVLVKPEKSEKKTGAGIYLPDSASEEKSQEGKVIAIGEDKKIKVKKGQKVVFRPYSGTELKIDGEECIIIKNEDILAIIG